MSDEPTLCYWCEKEITPGMRYVQHRINRAIVIPYHERCFDNWAENKRVLDAIFGDGA